MRLIIQRRSAQHPQFPRDRGKRIFQIVAEHRVNCRRSSEFARALKSRPRLSARTALRVAMKGDQIGEQLDRPMTSGRFKRAGRGSMAQSVPKMCRPGARSAWRCNFGSRTLRGWDVRGRPDLGDVFDDHGWPLQRISSQIVVSTFNSPPGCNPNSISSRTEKAIQRLSVTRATAANPIPVVRQMTSSMVGSASIPPIRGISRWGSSVNAYHR